MDSKVAATAGPPIREAWGCQSAKKGSMGVPLPNHRDHRDRPSTNGDGSLPPLNIVEEHPDVVVNGKCHCCPYGYHIDLDFVRFCDSMANGQYVRELKRLHRDRRKQRKSMEALLSFHEDQLKRKSSTGREESTPSSGGSGDRPLPDSIHQYHHHHHTEPPPPPDVVNTNDVLRDSLREAMLDFEDTFKKSTLPRDAGSNHRPRHHLHHTAPPSSLQLVPVDLLSNAHRVTLSTSSESGSSDASSPNLPGGVGLCYRHLDGGGNGYVSPLSRSRSGSVSSMCSLATTTADDEAAAEACRRVMAPSQQMADTMDALDNSVFRGGHGGPLSLSSNASGRSISPVVGINPSVLQSIRDQMCVSLNRMKELEEHAKAIPVLQVKLSVLKEEKRLLMLQLKAKAARLDLRSVGVGDSSVVCSESSDSEIGGDVLANNFRRGVTLKSPRDLVPEPRRTRAAGVNCVAMTRDVGVSHVQVQTRNIGTGNGDVSAPPPVAERKPCVDCARRAVTKSLAVNTERPRLSLSSCGRESIAPRPCESCEMRLAKQYRSVDAATDDTVTGWKSPARVQSPPPPPPPPATTTAERGTNTFRILSHHASVQALPSCRSAGLQTSPLPTPPLIAPKPTTHSRKVGCEVETRHFGANVNGRLLMAVCDVGVGHSSVHEVPVCETCALVTRRREGARTVAVGQHTVDDLLCDRCAHVKTRSVAVGTTWPKPTTRSVGVSSNKTTDVLCDRCENLCTTSVGVATDPLSPSVVPEKKPVNLCDKCNATITSVAQDLVHGQLVTALTSQRSASSNVTASAVISTSSSMLVSGSTVVVQGGKSKELPAAPSGSPPPRPPVRDYRKRRPPPPEFYMTDGFVKNEQSPPLPARGQAVTKAPGSPPTKDVGLLKVVSDSSESSGSSDDDSDSPDEASYDSVRGVIVHSCKDDEAIRQGLPGAVMFQPIIESPRQKFELSDEVRAACHIVDDFLKKSSKVPTKEVNSGLNLIRQDWFRISSQKTTDQHAVEDYIDELESISHQLLHKIVNLVDASGNTALHYAISYANFDVVSLLLDSKVCDISKPNKAGYSCIMLASLASIKEESHLSVLRQLFKLGDVNSKASQHGQTALMLAASHGKLEMLKLLLEAGADVNIQDDDGSTALMCASEHGHLAIVKYLLAQPDCDQNITDNDGSNALAIAMEAGHKDIGLLIYASTSLSRGNSPYASLRLKRSGSTPTRHVSTPPPQTPPPPSPARSRKSTSSVC